MSFLFLLCLSCVQFYEPGIFTPAKREHCSLASAKGLALLTSLWADPARFPEHRGEVMTAIARNIRNPHFSLLLLALDGPKELNDCETTRRAFHVDHHVSQAQLTKLVCTHSERPLSYFSMFSLSKSVDGHVFVLANGDMVFDDSVKFAKHVQSDTLLVLATRGAPHTWFRKVSERAPDRCYPPPKTRDSWDAYVFHPESLNLVESDWLDENTGRLFEMNKIWAEESALNALLASSNSISKIHQACDIIHTWHLHQASKTYDESAMVRVRHSGTIAKSCASPCECLKTDQAVNRYALTVYESKYFTW